MPRLGRARPASNYKYKARQQSFAVTVSGPTAAVTAIAPAGTIRSDYTVFGPTALVTVGSAAGAAGALIPASKTPQFLVVGPQGVTPSAGDPVSSLMAVIRYNSLNVPPWIRSQLTLASFSYSNFPFLPSILTEVMHMPSNATLDANVTVTGTVTAESGLVSQAGFATGSITTTTSAYTALVTDAVILANAIGGAFTVTLPDATQYGEGFAVGQRYTLKKIDSSVNNITVATTAGQTIDGASTYTLSSQYQNVTVLFDGSNWQII